MAHAFDSLGYAKRLRDAGVPGAQAEAHAEAARDFVMTDLVTKAYFDSTLRNALLTQTVAFGVMLAAAAGLIVAILKL